VAAGNVRLEGSAPASPFLTAVPAQTQTQSDTETSGNWAGYVAQSTSHTFTQAEIWYDEPASLASRCSSTAKSTWAGLGGWVSGDVPLAQNGTAIGVPGISAHQAWWEFWPYNDMVPIGFSATQGDKFTAEVNYEGSDAYNFWFYNYANGTSYSLGAETSALTGGAPVWHSLVYS
jgi:peptidase A4-like protein